ncbi:uncharacterized protein LOC116403552 isoform X1 [Cucumis sativus]|uniref:uncharacterized protein LOC116403552 isoform X1 n=1 Tax=Cucumis sativus TaxID=3659 RepID=UPI0012F48854|nr:uncharacterized protein LOC116403552 isoform X1 [Cucumis sativus]KAE8652876.1 hypothetical protein Csa_013031 [Cucumis sativus]
MAIQRVEVFYKQKQFYFYPAWAYLCYSSLIKIPLSLGESLVWTSLTHYVIGFTPQPISLLLTPLANRRWMDFKELKITISEILISLELSQECCGSWRRFIEIGLEGDANSDGEEDEMEDTDDVEVEHLHISDYQGFALIFD